MHTFLQPTVRCNSIFRDKSEKVESTFTKADSKSTQTLLKVNFESTKSSSGTHYEVSDEDWVDSRRHVFVTWTDFWRLESTGTFKCHLVPADNAYQSDSVSFRGLKSDT